MIVYDNGHLALKDGLFSLPYHNLNNTSLSFASLNYRQLIWTRYGYVFTKVRTQCIVYMYFIQIL